jgi:tripartite-type tricarboxylate transporter receptor subunit TctC
MTTRTQNMRLHRWIGAGLVATALVAAPSAYAENAAAFYKGKVVKILVGSPPGGGYDAYARIIAPHLAKKLGAQVIVENRPGGGGLLALNMLVAGKPDGLTLMHVSGEGALLSQITNRPGARWDVRKLVWLARTAHERKVWFFSTKSKLKTIADALKAKEVKWSATGPADNISDVEAIISYTLGLHSKIVTGYKGARGMALAVIKGETDAGVLSSSSAARLIKSGRLKGVAVVSRTRTPQLPSLPTIFQAAKVPANKAWLIDWREKIAEAQRAMVTTPGVPADRVAYLRQALRAVLTDPAVVAEAKKRRRIISFMPGKELTKVVDQALGLVKGKRLKLVKQIILKKYF